MATSMVGCLAPGGTVVTYGGMSRRPLNIPVNLLTYKQLKLEGFWMAQWYEDNGPNMKAKMMEEIISMVRSKTLTFFYKLHDLNNFHHALGESLEPYQLRKVILNLDHPGKLVAHDPRDDEDYWVSRALQK